MSNFNDTISGELVHSKVVSVALKGPALLLKQGGTTTVVWEKGAFDVPTEAINQIQRGLEVKGVVTDERIIVSHGSAEISFQRPRPADRVQDPTPEPAPAEPASEDGEPEDVDPVELPPSPASGGTWDEGRIMALEEEVKRLREELDALKPSSEDSFGDEGDRDEAVPQ